MANDQSAHMQKLLDGLAITADALEKHRVAYAVIGGMATSFRSQARFTKDLDFLLNIPQVTLPGLLETLAQRGYQFDETTTIREWIQHHMVAVSYQGVRVDWLKAMIPVYHQILDSATDETWLGQRIRVASAEGLILMKLMAGRTQDWLDIENLVAAQREKLDLDWIRAQWKTVGNDDDPQFVRLLELVNRARALDIGNNG
jgi:hypothetical protein